jgi:hypothetical protein
MRSAHTSEWIDQLVVVSSEKAIGAADYKLPSWGAAVLRPYTIAMT